MLERIWTRSRFHKAITPHTHHVYRVWTKAVDGRSLKQSVIVGAE
jgi:hypothetical protein